MSEVNYMKLFEEKTRSVEPQPMVLGETDYHFLDRCDYEDPYAPKFVCPAWVRSILNELFNEYPQEHANDLKKRFQAKKEHNFQSALF